MRKVLVKFHCGHFQQGSNAGGVVEISISCTWWVPLMPYRWKFLSI